MVSMTRRRFNELFSQPQLKSARGRLTWPTEFHLELSPAPIRDHTTLPVNGSQIRHEARLPIVRRSGQFEPRQHVRSLTTRPHPACSCSHVANVAQYDSSFDEQGCRIFTGRDGKMVQPMCADYGFRSGAGRLYQEHYGEIPKNVFELAKENFSNELKYIRMSNRFWRIIDPIPESSKGPVDQVSASVRDMFGAVDKLLEDAGVLSILDPPVLKSEVMTEEFEKIQSQLQKLKLDNDAVNQHGHDREAKFGALESPVWVKVPFQMLCLVLDVMYDKKPIQKFWVLETVARIPYFAYASMLHFYESIGFWRAGAELRKVHFAEEWNEMHHLQIMESLGGDRRWFDRFVAEHTSLVYYWVIILFFLLSPKNAYNFMERVEHHAADTYAVFLESNRELLEQIPPPYVALNYYLGEDLYMFDSFQMPEDGTRPEPRRPKCNNLAHVFTNIRDDEMEHVKTMDACQKDTISSILLKDSDRNH